MRRDRQGGVLALARAGRSVPAHAALRVALLAAAVAFSGCGALFGSRYDNFRAYYNTFFNARKAFEEGERGLRRPGQRVDRARFLPLFPTSQVGATATPAATSSTGPFQQAITKSADLLRERPGSRYADDALLLIGKSYFYTANYVGAEQKFRETIDAATAGRQRELLDEARFWLGRTLAAQRRFDEGASVLEAALSDPEGSRRWRARQRLALGALHADARRWEEAAATLAAALDGGGVGDDLAARAHFLRGQVLEAAGDHAGAAEAYGRALRLRPPYEIAYAAQLSRVLALGLGAGQHEPALEELRSMRRDGKHFANRAEVELAYARTLAAAGRGQEAGERYRAVLYERTLDGGSVRGEALYRFAEFHRDVRADLVSASAYFDSAAAVARTEPGREELITAAAITGARRTADVYGSYAELAERLTRVDSLLALGALDDVAFAERVARIESDRLVAWRAEQRRRERERAATGFTDVPIAASTLPLPGGTRPEEDGGGRPATVSPGTPPAGASAASGFLSYLDIARVQATQIAFERIWGDRPRVPNWRRRAAIGGAIASGPHAGPVGPEGLPTADRPPPLNLAEVPRSTEAQAAMRLERAALRYEIGNVLFLSVADPDAAAEWYRLVIDEDAGTAVSVRAVYALAELERARGNDAEAEALYRQVLESDPDPALLGQVRERLGMAAVIATAADEALAADSAYAAARSVWNDGRHAQAVADMLALAVAYPDTPAAPRALLGGGAIYTEWAHRDGLPLDAIPDSLVPAPIRAAAPPDSARPAPRPRVAAPADTVRVDGGAVSPADSLIAAAGEPASADSLRPAPGEATLPRPAAAALPEPAAGDTLAAPPGPRGSGFGLADLYRVLIAQYPDTPYAARAEALLNVLAGEEAPPSADSAAGAARPLADAARPRAAGAGLMGEEMIDPARGGFTWRVARVPTPLGARALLRNFLRRGFRTAVNVDVASDGQPFYGVVVGQFETLEDAESVRDALPVAGGGAGVEILPLGDMVLLEESQLTGDRDGPGAVED